MFANLKLNTNTGILRMSVSDALKLSDELNYMAKETKDHGNMISNTYSLDKNKKSNEIIVNGIAVHLDPVEDNNSKIDL